MARTSGGGSRFASSNLNDLYGKQVLPGISSSKSRFGPSSANSHHHHHHYQGGSFHILSRPTRSSTSGKSLKPPQPKLTVPAPVNLPSLRKEHAGNDPSIPLVGSSGIAGWSKQQVHQHSHGQGSAEQGGGDSQLKSSNGWGTVQTQHATSPGPVSASEGVGRPGKYTPPGARVMTPPSAQVSTSGSSGGNTSVVPVVLRGEDFPTLQAAVPVAPAQSQHRQRDMQLRHKEKQRDMKQQRQEEPEQEKGRDELRSSSPVLLQPNARQGGGYRDEQRNSYMSFKENRKPNDVSLRPGPLIHLSTHTSNWAEDERETASSRAPEWDDGPRYGQGGFSRPGLGNNRRDPPREYGRSSQDFGWDRRNGGNDLPEMGEHRDFRGNSWNRERDSFRSNFLPDGFGRDSFFQKGDRGRFGVRSGVFDLPVRGRGAHVDDSFLRNFPELPDLRSDLKYRTRRRKDMNEDSYRDLERESFETELERVQKEQEQERQRRIEERERAIELAKKEQEERERLAREEEERHMRAEREAREAAARAEQEAYDSVRKSEVAKRAREEEKRRAFEEEERRKENARRKLMELEERIAQREQQRRSEHSESPTPRLDEDPERMPPPRYASPNMQQDSSRYAPPVHQEQRFRSNDIQRKDRDDKWMSPADSFRNESPFRNAFSPRMSSFMDNTFQEDERRWNRRSRESRPFSPPSPTSFDTSDELQHGRLRQSLPKQPRVPPPPSRSQVLRPSSIFSGPAVTNEDARATEPKDVSCTDENVERGPLAEDKEDDSVVCSGDENAHEDVASLEVQPSVNEHDSVEPELSGFADNSVEERSEVIDEVFERVDQEAAEDVEQEQERASMNEQESIFSNDTAAGLQDTEHVTADEQVIDEEPLSSANLVSELVNSLVQKEVEEVTVGELEMSVTTTEEIKSEQIIVKDESDMTQPSDPSANTRPLLPAPQPPLSGMQSFHQPPNFMAFDPRPRMQAPHPERPMTLQFGLLPGTSLSIPIQIGSIPLQLHPPIGPHVPHMQPPQFQFGQLGQQAPLMPYPVHHQTMMQPSLMNMDGNQHMRMSQADRAPWAGAGPSVPRKNVEEVGQEGQNFQAQQQPTGPKPTEDVGPSGKLFETPAAEPSEEDDFIEVRSKRQQLNDRSKQKDLKDKQGKGKQKHMKSKEQATKQRTQLKPLQVGSSSRKESTSLRNCSLDEVVTNARTRQASLSNAEVGFEKRTKSPQNSLVPEAPAFPSVVSEGQNATHGNGLVAWGFNRANQELENAIKPARYDTVPMQPAQPSLPDNLNTALDSDKGLGPPAAPGPISSLLAGEKIQFGAVTSPAFVSPVPWLGPRPEGFRKDLPDDSELSTFGKNKRLREHEDTTGGLDSEAEAEAAASAVAVAAISNDDYGHNTEQLVLPHGVMSSASNKGSPTVSGNVSQPTPSSDIDETTLPADLSIDMSLRGPPHSGQLLPGGFRGMEMGTLLGGPAFGFGAPVDGSRDTGSGMNAERPAAPNWQPQPHHTAVDSFYGNPHGYAGAFVNHGPIPSIPPHTLVYRSPFGGVGQFGQLGVSYMGPGGHMPPVKQPDWKHTPVSSSAGVSGADMGGHGGNLHYAQHSNRHLDPSVIPVVPPPFDMYREMGFQSQWSHVPGPHAPIPPFAMPMRHPHPAYHMPQHPADMMNEPGAGIAPPEPSDQFPDELGLGDSLSSTSDANSSFVVQQTPAKPSSPACALPGGSKLRSRVVVTGADNGGSNSRPNSGNAGSREASCNSGFQPQSYVSSVTGPRRGPPPQQDKRNSLQQNSKTGGGGGGGTVTTPAWSSQGRKLGGGQVRAGGQSVGSGGGERNNSSPAKLKQVYVVKPATSSTSTGGTTTTVANNTNNNNNDSCSEIYSADVRHM